MSSNTAILALVHERWKNNTVADYKQAYYHPKAGSFRSISSENKVIKYGPAEEVPSKTQMLAIKLKNEARARRKGIEDDLKDIITLKRRRTKLFIQK